MNVKYNREVDIVYIRLTDNPIAKSDEDRPGVVIDYDANGLVVGFEIMNASKRITRLATVEVEVA